MLNQKPSWYRRWWQRLRREVRWLTPGLGVKRWIVIILIGTTLIGIGLAMFALDIYRNSDNSLIENSLKLVSLTPLSRPLRVAVFGSIGVGILLVGIWGLNRSLLKPFVQPGQPVIEAVSTYRKRERGPRIVTLGGGHGLSALLRGLKSYSNNITAIVTVADDGGSSGELRRSIGILPPGDIRNCLAALSNDEALMTQIFQYRFVAGAGLDGHTLGNLFITALTGITGSFEEAVAESARVLAVQGRVLPATIHDVRLMADVQVPNHEATLLVRGESAIPASAGKVRRVWLEPNNPPAFPPAIAAILAADLIVVGPGSLYTSILPNLLVPDLAEAIAASRAVKFYVCNAATQPGETDGYSCGEHLRTIEKHINARLFDVVICNNRWEGTLPEGVSWVSIEPGLDQQYPLYQTDLLDIASPWRHDSTKLAQVVTDLYNDRTGPLVS